LFVKLREGEISGSWVGIAVLEQDFLVGGVGSSFTELREGEVSNGWVGAGVMCGKGTGSRDGGHTGMLEVTAVL